MLAVSWKLTGPFVQSWSRAWRGSWRTWNGNWRVWRCYANQVGFLLYAEKETLSEMNWQSFLGYKKVCKRPTISDLQNKCLVNWRCLREVLSVLSQQHPWTFGSEHRACPLCTVYAVTPQLQAASRCLKHLSSGLRLMCVTIGNWEKCMCMWGFIWT